MLINVWVQLTGKGSERRGVGGRGESGPRWMAFADILPWARCGNASMWKAPCTCVPSLTLSNFGHR